MSVHDLWRNAHDPDPPGPEETIWVLHIRARPDSGAGYNELKEFVEHIKVFGKAALKSTRFIKKRSVLRVRVRSFKSDPEGFNWIFLNELPIWPELEVIESREEPPCQADT